MRSCRRNELYGCKSLTLIGNFPYDLFATTHFNETEVHKGLKLQFSCLWNNMNGDITFKIIRQYRKVILKSLIILAFISNDYFRI